ncbi:hypothetical protein ACFOUP_05830 [Belliella kenyensis]|uniref:Secreted protein n=1 Tax=Belliella kenyensis TaxID=1472724 RepID=A0ABV8EJ18_9BACT|nr:hypothetical protein [Belliella kenyensis]MCH7401421.1 hypothetical protein [Belliella kenyensis]MDN3602864.1 hypothetical protein [Belliella kenyensis]
MKKSILILSIFLTSIPTFAQTDQTGTEHGSLMFWNNLSLLCGKSFEGEMVNASEKDQFYGKKLVMHVRTCEDGKITIPFHVGDDHSRTWVLTLEEGNMIKLKHDHRHEDGSEDRITQYGGMSSNTGMAKVQFFPADQETTDLIPYAATNVWWITLDEKSFSYNLRRINNDTAINVKFDLSKEVETPPTPWGW